MEIIRRKTEATLEELNGFSSILQYSYNSDGHLTIRVRGESPKEDMLIVLTMAQTGDLFRFIKRINGVKD